MNDLKKLLAILVIVLGIPINLYIINQGDVLAGILLIIAGLPHVCFEYIKYRGPKDE